MIVQLTDGQRHTLTAVLDHEDCALREGSLPLRELAERALFLARISDLATAGAGSLADVDEPALAEMLIRHGREWAERAEVEVGRLPLIEADDPDWRISGLDLAEDLVQHKEQIETSRTHAAHCSEIRGMLDAEAVPA